FDGPGGRLDGPGGWVGVGSDVGVLPGTRLAPAPSTLTLRLVLLRRSALLPVLSTLSTVTFVVPVGMNTPILGLSLIVRSFKDELLPTQITAACPLGLLPVKIELLTCAEPGMVMPPDTLSCTKTLITCRFAP